MALGLSFLVPVDIQETGLPSDKPHDSFGQILLLVINDVNHQVISSLAGEM
jgi:hypothetical protein